jgi:hypothetical protein
MACSERIRQGPIGPDFKSGYVDALPVSNADVGATAAKLLGLTQKARGKLIGRVMTEAMPNGARRKNFSGTEIGREIVAGVSRRAKRSVPTIQDNARQ